MTRLITGTFNALTKVADFSAPKPVVGEETSLNGTSSTNGKDRSSDNEKERLQTERQITNFHPDFRFNIEVHLPSSGTEETYLAIFNALRKSLG